MNVLEDFWYGNLEPAEYDANPSKEYKELVRLISRNEEKLLATMTEEQKELFSRYMRTPPGKCMLTAGRCACVPAELCTHSA